VVNVNILSAPAKSSFRDPPAVMLSVSIPQPLGSIAFSWEDRAVLVFLDHAIDVVKRRDSRLSTGVMVLDSPAAERRCEISSFSQSLSLARC